MTRSLVQHPVLCEWVTYVPDDDVRMSPINYMGGRQAAGRAQARLVTALWGGCLVLWIGALTTLAIDLAAGSAPLLAMWLGAASFALAFAGAGIGCASVTTVLRRPAFVPMVQRRIARASVPVAAGAFAPVHMSPRGPAVDAAHVRHRRPAPKSRSGSAFPRGRTACIGRVDSGSVRRRRRGR